MTDSPVDITSTPIELCKTFEAISKWREASFKVYQNSGDDYKGVLSDIYREPTHFMFELLQNANDAQATKVRFEVKSDRIVFYHNGTRDFTPSDVISITGIGNSTKKGNEKSIGKFGVGFKAVFAITATPKIWSRTYNFRIENLTVPYEIEPVELGEWTTIFEFAYESDKYTPEQIYKRILGEAEVLDIQTILFLHHIRELQVATDDYRVVRLEHEQRDGYTEFSDPADGSRYLVFRGGHHGLTSIAYRLDADGNIIKPRNTNVSVYFPTQVKSFLGFVVNAPFSTPRTRETIDFTDLYNPVLVDEVKAVFRASVLKLRDLGLWTSGMIQNFMPVNSELREESPIYDHLFDALEEAFKQEKLVATRSSRFVPAGNAVIPYDDTIAKLYDHKEKKWASISVHQTLLTTYYRQTLSIPLIDFGEFIKLCTPDFLKRQKTSWLYQFYSYCSDKLDKDYASMNLNFLRQRPVMKSRSGNFIAAYVEESQNIFMNSKGLGNARIVDNMFTTTSTDIPKETRDKLLNLLDKLEIKARSPKSTVELDIMRKWAKASLEERKELFGRVVDIYNQSNKDEKAEIVAYLSGKDFLFTADGEWASYDVYQDMPNLHLLFDGVVETSYIHPDFWSVDYKERSISQKDGTSKLVKSCHGSNELLEALGVSGGLKVYIQDYSQFVYRFEHDRHVFKSFGVPGSGGNIRVEFTHEITDFATILENIDTPEKSRALVAELLAIPDDEYKGEVGFYTSGRASRKDSGYPVPAQFILELNDVAWIFDGDGTRRSPDEVFEDDFVELYGIDDTEKLPGIIGFKPSVRKSLPPEDQEKLALLDDVSVEELKEFKRLKAAEHAQDDRPAVVFEDVTRKIVLDEGKAMVESEAGTDRAETKFNVDPHESTGSVSEVRERVEKVAIKKTDNTKQVIGDQGEHEIFAYLRKQHTDAVDIDGGFTAGGKTFRHLGKTNPGYDIEVSEAGEIIEYIEVKARTAETDPVIISNKEWEYAQNFGDKYTLYIVSGIGNEDATEYRLRKYNDPFRKRTEGKITLVPDTYRLT